MKTVQIVFINEKSEFFFFWGGGEFANGNEASKAD